MKTPCRETLERYLERRGPALSAVTLRHYRKGIASLLEFLHRHHPEIDSLSELRRTPHIEGWLKMLATTQPPYRDSTRVLYIYKVRRFFLDTRDWGWPECPPVGLVLPEDTAANQGSFPPKRRLEALSRRLGTSPDAMVAHRWYRLLERYLIHRSATLRPATLIAPRVTVLSLMEFLWKRFPEVDCPSKLRRSPHIEGWLQFLVESRHLKILTRRQYIHNLRRFLEDLRGRDGHLGPPPRLLHAGDLPRIPRPSRPRNRFLSLIGAPAGLPGGQHQEAALHKTLERYLDIRGATVRPGTVRHYRLSVLSLIELLRVRFPEVDSFEKLRRDPHIELWLHELARVNPPFRNGTRRERIRGLLRFLEDLTEWGWPEAPPAGLIRLSDFPPGDHCLPKPPSPDVDAALMAALMKEGDIPSLGLVLARRTGLRVGELRRLELDCLLEDSQGHYSLKVPLGKLRTERVIPVDQETAELVTTLKRLRGQRPRVADPETGQSLEALICDEAGRFLPSNLFRRKVKAAARSAGIAQNVHPHRLRHTYATELLRNGLSLPGVMKLLGHKTVKMTLRYVEVTNEDLGRDYLRAMERARQRYSTHGTLEAGTASEQQGQTETIDSAFDRLVSRIQALRFDHPDPKRRHRLQRLVERLRRAQRDFADGLR